MSSLPPEVLDLIIDHLHDEPVTLKTCCVISKSWVPRTRKHLFAYVEFYYEESREPRIDLWKKTFPDPSNSPARHTRRLFIDGLPIDSTDAIAGDWIRTFRSVECLEFWNAAHASLIPFHALSPVVRSLRLTFFSTEVFDLICSFPLLEDLEIDVDLPVSGGDERSAPLTSPKLTGSLCLWIGGWTGPVTRRLLALPGGLHFSKVNVMFVDHEAESTRNLVFRCSDTLASLTVGYHPSDTPRTICLDLSKATKLKHLGFRRTSPMSSVRRIAMTLQTVKSKNLQSITIHLTTGGLQMFRKVADREWNDVDQLLVQFWTSHSIRTRVVYVAGIRGEDTRGYVSSLLPELTRRGLVDLVETHFWVRNG